MSELYIPQPETTLDIAASVLGALTLAKKHQTVSNVMQYVNLAMDRTEELIKKIEGENHEGCNGSNQADPDLKRQTDSDNDCERGARS